jgi:hypothetical protein
MKVIIVTAVGTKKEDIPNVRLVVGPGIYYRWGEENKATIVNTVNGTILIKETPEQIDALINKEGA